MRRFEEAEWLAMHETQNSEVVVAEWIVHGQVTATGSLLHLIVHDGGQGPRWADRIFA